MNKFLSRKNVNLDISTKCTLACPKCWREYYKSIGSAPIGHNMTIEEFNKIVSHFDYITFCGQISDPVLHPKFNEFLKILNDLNKDTAVRTAVSHKPMDWYRKAFQINPKATWIFGIDGLPEDSHKYRIRQDGAKLFDIMLMGKNMGVNVVWSCIVMKYNENDIPKVKEIAKQNNIVLEIVKSSRWEDNDKYKPENDFNYIESEWRKHIND